MLVAQGFWDQLQWDNIAAGLDRLYYLLQDWVLNVGPGTLLVGAVVLGLVYYIIVRPR